MSKCCPLWSDWEWSLDWGYLSYNPYFTSSRSLSGPPFPTMIVTMIGTMIVMMLTSHVWCKNYMRFIYLKNSAKCLALSVQLKLAIIILVVNWLPDWNDFSSTMYSNTSESVQKANSKITPIHKITPPTLSNVAPFYNCMKQVSPWARQRVLSYRTLKAQSL